MGFIRSTLGRARRASRGGHTPAEAAFREEFDAFEKLSAAAAPGRFDVRWEDRFLYSYDQVKGYSPELELKEFALIPDNPQDGGLVYGATREMAESQSYGCGCFWFERKGA